MSDFISNKYLNPESQTVGGNFIQIVEVFTRLVPVSVPVHRYLSQLTLGGNYSGTLCSLTFVYHF